MKKYAIVEIPEFEISTKKKKKFATLNRQICGFELTKLIILLIFRILHHHDVITILYWTYEFRFEIRVSNLVCMLNVNSKCLV